ncbi:MAG: 5'-deoxyadenosine deaminase [Ignavibacteriae bacterium]|nr:5'-deoxyadenosine deaminase [Ignavibacteriota bacterium]
MTKLLQVGRLVTGKLSGDVLTDVSIKIEKNRIVKIFPSDSIPQNNEEIVDAKNFIAIPGFIQTHVHLCQTLFRGLADDLELLDWLQQRIMPFEAAHNEHSMYSSAMLGIAELIRSGTTTILDMGSVNHQEEIIRAVGETGFRAFVGKAMMDVNGVYQKLKETTDESLKSTRRLAERWHNSYNGRVKYAVAPRFVLSCSDSLMKEANEMLGNFNGMLFHTHASENKNEVKAVRERCKMENIEFLHHLGVLSEKACLAHCIHLNENEVGILKNTRTNVAHCPSSNLKLGSGIANVPHLQSNSINVSIGADGAPCNNNLNMFQEMRLASLLQKPIHGPTAMPAQSVFQMAMLNGAKALGLEREIGSIEVGKKADIVLLDLNNVWNSTLPEKDMYSTIVYSATPENVDSVMIDGEWVYRKKEFVKIDQEKLVADSRSELTKLLDRVAL